MTRLLCALLVVGAVIAACGDSSENGDDGAVSGETPILTDSGAIWCDENRWVVVARASQLELAVPAEMNPASDVKLAESRAQREKIEADLELGRISSGSAIRQLGDLREEILAVGEKYESGEWHPSGVKSDSWAAYQADEPNAYVRACQAAFDLRD